MKEDLLREVLSVVSMSIRLKRTLQDKILWSKQLRELLHLPENEMNNNIVKEYLKNGTTH